MRNRPAKPSLTPCQSLGTRTEPPIAAGVVDGPDEAARLRLVRALVHQLEVEVEVVDRVPAEVGADQPGRCASAKERPDTNWAAPQPKP